MAAGLPEGNLKKLDKDLKKIERLEQATQEVARSRLALVFGALFLVAVWAFTSVLAGEVENSVFIILAGVVGGYMALNIGANDVANNVGPAVGSKALTMVGALLIAAVCEAGGAILAGGDVVSTISKGIIDPAAMPGVDAFIWAMLSALLAAALWINLATWINAPVSTTHAIVGGVMGAGIVAAGFDAVAWPTMGAIAASWVISPVLGGVIAALFLQFVKTAILFREDRVAAAVRWIPVLVGIMAAAFTMYMMMKGLKRIWKPDLWMILSGGVAGFLALWSAARPFIAKRAQGMENRRKAVSTLFTVPLILSAALLSFAHGANDVANAVGPLAAIVYAVEASSISAEVSIPFWVLVVGAIGIAAGLFLFGPKLIRTVGEKITKLDRARAFCVALSAAITVIAASWLGLPVSSTHIAVGGVFGVGFLREYHANRRKEREMAETHDEADSVVAEAASGEDPELRQKIEKKRAKAERRRLVRRQHLMTIIAAWVITVPLAALLSGGIFLVLRTVLDG